MASLSNGAIEYRQKLILRCPHTFQKKVEELSNYTSERGEGKIQTSGDQRKICLLFRLVYVIF